MRIMVHRITFTHLRNNGSVIFPSSPSKEKKNEDNGSLKWQTMVFVIFLLFEFIAIFVFSVCGGARKRR